MKNNKRRGMLISSGKVEPLYIYSAGDSAFSNCTHRSESYSSIFGSRDTVKVSFSGSYCQFSDNGASGGERVYYLYIDTTRYRKLIVRAWTTTAASGGDGRVGLFSSDGLDWSSSFTDANSQDVNFWTSGPKDLEFDVTDMIGQKVLAIGIDRAFGMNIYEIRLE